MYQHFKAIAKATDIPIIIYNIPGRCAVSMNPKTFKRLNDEMPNIFVGLKDSTGNTDSMIETLKIIENEFSVFCGDDILAKDFANANSKGCVSVTANVAPLACGKMQEKLMSGDVDGFNEINKKFINLHNSLFLEPSPAPVKYALKKLGLIEFDVARLPMVEIVQQTKDKIDLALSEAGLL